MLAWPQTKWEYPDFSKSLNKKSPGGYPREYIVLTNLSAFDYSTQHTPTRSCWGFGWLFVVWVTVIMMQYYNSIFILPNLFCGHVGIRTLSICLQSSRSAIDIRPKCAQERIWTSDLHLIRVFLYLAEILEHGAEGHLARCAFPLNSAYVYLDGIEPPTWTLWVSCSTSELKIHSTDDGTRTRDLCRERATL